MSCSSLIMYKVIYFFFLFMIYDTSHLGNYNGHFNDIYYILNVQMVKHQVTCHIICRSDHFQFGWIRTDSSIGQTF